MENRQAVQPVTRPQPPAATTRAIEPLPLQELEWLMIACTLALVAALMIGKASAQNSSTQNSSTATGQAPTVKLSTARDVQTELNACKTSLMVIAPVLTPEIASSLRIAAERKLNVRYIVIVKAPLPAILKHPRILIRYYAGGSSFALCQATSMIATTLLYTNRPVPQSPSAAVHLPNFAAYYEQTFNELWARSSP